MCIVENQHLTQNKKMKTSSITALIFAALLAGVAVAADAQTPEIPAMPAASQLNQTELTWLTDLPKALAQAKAEGKSVLLFFHGSDWCPPCVEMQSQVFASPEFIQYARRALIS
jgi:thiol:disulfide interchange protein